MDEKKRSCLSWVIAALAMFIVSCDDGRIYPEEEEEQTGGKGIMQVTFQGDDAWPQSYMLIFAAFDADGKVPIKSKVISRPMVSGTPVAVTLNGLNEQIKRLSIAVVNKGRELIYEFYSYPVEDVNQEITLPVSEINLAEYDRIQQQVFDAYCIRCHGAGEHAAANLNLTSSYSYKALINQSATLSETGELLVEPNQIGRSFLVDILKEDLIQYNHTDVLPESELIDLIETWIEGGGQE